MAPRKRNDAMSEDELMAAIARARSMGGGGPYRGQPNSPDLPSEQDYRTLNNNPTDSGYSGFVNRFGFERLNPDAEKPDYVPTPRPREPMLDYNNPLGPRQRGVGELTEQGADISDQQIDAAQQPREDYFQMLERIQEQLRQKKGGALNLKPPREDPYDRSQAPGYSDEDLLELVQHGLISPRK